MFLRSTLTKTMLALCMVAITIGGLCSYAQAGGAGVSVEKFTISRNDEEHECFPSLARLKNGRIVLVYRESDIHVAKTHARVIVRTSDDDGKTWSDRTVLVDSQEKDGVLIKYNCPKVQQLKDGRVLIICDEHAVSEGHNGKNTGPSTNILWFSEDNCKTWSKPYDTKVGGIMPDEVIELDNGDWLMATQFRSPEFRNTVQCVSRSTDKGKTWGEPVVVAAKKGYNLCEASVLKMPGGELICYMRENSGKGWPGYKSISTDNGKTWQGPYETMMAACHRPVAHLTRSGKVMITYRYQPGAKGPWAKNTFAYLESVESALEPEYAKQSGMVLPLDHDRNPKSDGGYTGWVETEPGEFLVVNYIMDDAPKAQIRGYRFNEDDF